MKVLHICGGLPVSNQSGIPNYVRNLAINQCSMGYDVSVLANQEKETSYPFVLKEYSSKIKSFSKGKIIDKKALSELEEYFRKEQFDIINLHMVMNIDWDIYSILKPYNYIVSLHDYWFLCPRVTMFWKGKSCSNYDENACKKCVSYIERFRICRGISKSIAKKFNSYESYVHFPQMLTVQRYNKYKQLLENATYVLPVSTRVMQIFQDSEIKANYKVVHISNITADQINKQYKYKKHDKKINVVFLGRLTKAKGADVLINIASGIDQSKYQIHFFGQSATYANKIKECGIIDHGKYQQVELPKILEKMDLGMVLPIWEDNGPQVVMEMLNNHIPVIGTKMGGLTDFVKSGVNGFVFDPLSPEGYNNLFKYFDELTEENIRTMSEGIEHTTTTVEHLDELNRIYVECIQKNKKENN